MANFLVANELHNTGAGRDGIVVDSSGKIFFLATRFFDAQNHLKIYESTDGGATWSLLQDISPMASGDLSRLFCAMYMDANNSLHLCHWTTTQAYQYKRYDPPSYSLSIDELAGGTVDSTSPTGIAVTSSGIVYIFYQMTQNPAPANYILRYGRRTGVNTWVMDTNMLSGNTNLGTIDYDMLMSSDGETIYFYDHLVGGANNITVKTLVGTTITNLFVVVTDSVNQHNTYLAEVNGVIRAYDSLRDGIAGSAEIFFTTQAGGRNSLFTSPRSGDALRGVSQDAEGINIFYGGTSGALYRRHHRLNGLLSDEVIEIPSPTFYLPGQSTNHWEVAYPRKISGFVGGSGYYAQPNGSTRFFSTLVATASPVGQEGAFSEPFLQEWGIGLEELMFVGSGARRGITRRGIRTGEEEEDL